MNHYTVHPKIFSSISNLYLTVLYNSQYTYSCIFPSNYLVLTIFFISIKGIMVLQGGPFQGVSPIYDKAFRYLI